MTAQIFSNHNVLSYVAMISIIVVSILLNKTPLGMRIKAAGEFPEALESVGVKVASTPDMIGKTLIQTIKEAGIYDRCVIQERQLFL